MIQPILTCGESALTDLSVFLNTAESDYEVYIGLALLERVKVSPDDLQHKMLIGRLYNARVKLKDIREKFSHDNRTIKKWGNALKSGDMNIMLKAFAGKKVCKKTTPELIRYVQQLYRHRSQMDRNYRELIILKTEEVFGVSISPSLASAIFKSVEDKTETVEQSPTAADSEFKKEDISGVSDVDLSSKKDSTVQRLPIFPLLSEG